jgi:hypothetical protein
LKLKYDTSLFQICFKFAFEFILRRYTAGIVTGATVHDVAAADGCEPAAVKLSDPRVTAAVVTGANLLHWGTADWDAVLSKPEVRAQSSEQRGATSSHIDTPS